ncbi:MAG: 23S rRNA (guanosine(2251)-2'-O)-methyltransferase RlmB [Deltaproteobacteria bacterium]|nr:MAG: 23S rRNA (guanosine(2251)-2'-O)-methyltransferase RlmB [Deltaproteobacteria bacterium]
MSRPDQLEGRNVVLEALHRRRRRVHRVLLDERARSGGKVDRILAAAEAAGVPVQRVPRRELDRRSRTGVHNGVIAEADPLPETTVRRLLDELFAAGTEPFLVVVDEVQYEHNLGAVMRSALGAGVHGVIVPVRRGKGLTPVVQRVAMGGAEAVPLVREGISSALAQMRRAGIRIVGCDMDGDPVWDVDLRGPVALVLGGEDKGLSPTLRKRCDAVASVPLAGDLESLNVSVTAAVMMFEKRRQERAGG